MGVLHIQEVPQYGVLTETIDELPSSLFIDVYRGAIKNVFDIIQGQKNSKNELFFNPCIAFVGKRGTGKSSAMSSFANFLKTNSEETCKWINDEKVQNKISKTKFYTLSAIDTANMSKKETIIADIVAEMYHEYKSVSQKLSVDKKRLFLEAIKKISDTAVLKNSSEWTNQSDQLLVDTDKVVHIKKLFEESVSSFLSIIGETSNCKDCYLVVQIDDLDMNTSNAFSIMEELRTIINVKNIIILVSVDVQQLKSILKLDFSSSLINHSSKEETETAKRIANDLSYQYIEKLLPVARRHYMPELTSEQLSDHRSQNFLGDNDENWYKMGLCSKESETPTIIDAVLHLIWRKTMLVAMKNQHNDFVILPHNLRSLCNFIVFLRSMPDAAYCNSSSKPLTYFDYADKDKGEYRRNVLERNLHSFNKYIISNIESFCLPEMNSTDEKLSKTLINLIQTFSDVSLGELNSKIANDIIFGLKSCVTENDINKNNAYFNKINENACLDNIEKATVYADTISMGDVMFILGKIEKFTRCSYIRYLIGVIRILWSIRMTKELFINGCAPENNDNCEPRTNFITLDFRRTVGAMLVNPDATESFDSSVKNTENRDWFICPNKKKQSIYDIVVPNNKEHINIANNTTYKINNWRVQLKVGKSCYHFNNKDKDAQYCYLSHPMLIFTNLLYPALIDSDENSEVVNKYVQWQNNFIMAFPFYSMDYMSRFYKEFRNQVKINACEINTAILTNVFNNANKAAESLKKEITKYIPHIALPENIDITPYKIESDSTDDFIFDIPRKALEITIEDETAMFFINEKVVDILKLATEIIPTLDLEKKEKTISEVEMAISRNIPVYFQRKNESEVTGEDRYLTIKSIYDNIKAYETSYYYEQEVPDFEKIFSD